MSEKRKLNNDIYIGLLLILTCVYFLYKTTSLPEAAARFPLLIYSTLLLMSIALLALGIRKTIRPELTLKSDTLLNLEVVKAPFAILLISAVYVALIGFVGFFIATALFVPATMIFYGTKDIKVILITDIALNAFVYVLFVRVLKVMLP